jgi:hypothetical protein
MLYIFCMIHTTEPYFIKNQHTPKCTNCKFFIPTNNKCSKFGEVDIITNEYKYEPAINVRRDDSQCGEDAIFFKQNYFKMITVPYYVLTENSAILILCGSILLPYILYVFLLIRLK